MAILRSRAPASAGPDHGGSGPQVQRAILDWEARVAAAHEAGRLAGLAEAKARINEAEKRASGSDARAEEKQAQRQREFLARFEPPLSTLVAAAERMAPLEKQLVQEAEAQSVRLALAIAAVILRKTIASDPTWVGEVARHALTQVSDRRNLVVRMHPTDAGSLREYLPELRARLPGIDAIEVLEDLALARGACVVLSRGTRLDASVAGCWERLAAELLAMAPANDCQQVVPGKTVPSRAAGSP